jgi:hypothetical protein
MPNEDIRKPRGHVARHVGGKSWTPLAVRGDNRSVIRSDTRKDAAPTPAHGSPGASMPLPPDKEKR